jgi:hypothetical protein
MEFYPLHRDKIQKPKQIKDREVALAAVYERLKERHFVLAQARKSQAITLENEIVQLREILLREKRITSILAVQVKVPK